MDNEPITFEYEGLKKSIAATQAALLNPRPRLKKVGQLVVTMVKDLIEAGGEGWAPYAPSTLKRLMGSGTSTITRGGIVRAAQVRKLTRALDKQYAAVRDKGWDPARRKAVDRTIKRIASLRKQEERAQSADASMTRFENAHRSGGYVNLRVVQAGKRKRVEIMSGPNKGEFIAFSRGQRSEVGTSFRVAASEIQPNAKGKLRVRKDAVSQKQGEDVRKRDVQKRDAATLKLLRNMPKTIRMKLYKRIVLIYSRVSTVADAQNEMRRYIPPKDMPRVIEYMAKVMETDLEEAWNEGSAAA